VRWFVRDGCVRVYGSRAAKDAVLEAQSAYHAAPKSKRGGWTTQKAGKEGMGSGIARGRDILEGQSVDAVQVAQFFRRKAKVQRQEEAKGKTINESPQLQAWGWWGGDPMWWLAEEAIRKAEAKHGRKFGRCKRSANGRGTTMRARAKNAQGRVAYYDDITGTVVPGTYEGARESLDRVVRVRPERGAPFELLEFDPETADPTRDTYGVDPSFNRMYKAEAKAKAKARKRRRRRKPLEEDSAPGLREVGVRTTFDSARAAAREFMAANDHIFENSHFDDIEIHDDTRDFMDAIDVPVGGKRKTVKYKGGERQKIKYTKLVKTPRGQEILGAGKRAGDCIAREMMVFLFGMAGPRRRYIDVPWGLVTSYTDMIVARMHDDAEWRMEREGPPVAGVAWYPLAADLWDEEDLVKAAIEEVGYEKALKLAEWVNSQRLYRMADSLESILKPPKGPGGKDARKRLKCIPKGDRKILRHRLRQIREWAAYPDEIPDWACDPIQDFEHGNTRVCRFPALERDLAMIHAACREPYDPSWPQRLRVQLDSEGKLDEDAQYRAGIMPIDPSEIPQRGPSVELDEPWEREEPWIDEPWLEQPARAANPETRRLRNRLVRY
jgi:hypothetical protein